MKKTLLLAAVAVMFTAGSAFAQIEQGTVLVGASSNLNFSSTSYDGADDKLTSFNLDLSAGYFVIENLALGLQFAYVSEKMGDEDFSGTGIGVFGRYYFGGKIFAGAGYQSFKAEDSDAVSALPLQVGYAAFITDNIAVEPSLGYTLGLGDNESSTFGINVGFSLYLNRN